MKNDELFKKFLFRFPGEQGFHDLFKLLEEEKVEEAFKVAHSMKGVTANLALKSLNEALKPHIFKAFHQLGRKCAAFPVLNHPECLILGKSALINPFRYQGVIYVRNRNKLGRNGNFVPFHNRVKGFTKILAEEMMKEYPEYELGLSDVEMISSAAALHDIGKIAIPDNILLKLILQMIFVQKQFYHISYPLSDQIIIKGLSDKVGNTDYELNMELATDILTMCKAVVVQAENGKKALDIFSASDEFFFDASYIHPAKSPLKSPC